VTDFDKLTALRAPFAAEQVGHLPKVTCGDCSQRSCSKHQRRKCRTCSAFISTQHVHIDFVGHAHVTERLLEVDPLWTWEPVAFHSGTGLPALDDGNGLWIRLTVGGMTRFGYGHAAGKRGGDAMKETIGDAIRNAAMRFGVALDLWKKDTPAPVADEPREPDQPQSPEDRAAELRGQIMTLSKRAGRGKPEEAAEDFTLWSQGKDIRQASVAVLAEYKDHLQRQGGAS